ncbi:MAG: hypothetical protein K0R00_1000 [Herbinix sp.]|jgi:hypothetical protein|nr:hypothetical protein [Herbinix sp.]
MKKNFSFSKLVLVALLAVIMVSFAACTAVQISTSIDLKEDGSGSRTITASIAKDDDNQDGYGSAYYYFKKHGSELADYLKAAYEKAVPGSEGWLTISVDNSGTDWEVINFTFEFTSFADYKTKLASLAYDETAAAAYAAPELLVNEDGTATYSENAATLTAIFKSLQTTIMADDTVFDFNSTKDGTALNNGSADLKSLTDYGVELMKPENGNAITIQLGSGKATAVEAADGVYKITGAYVASAPEAETDTTTDTTETSTENTATEEATANDETAAEVPKTGESIAIAVISFVCLAGCATGFVLMKKRSKNQ